MFIKPRTGTLHLLCRHLCRIRCPRAIHQRDMPPRRMQHRIRALHLSRTIHHRCHLRPNCPRLSLEPLQITQTTVHRSVLYPRLLAHPKADCSRRLGLFLGLRLITHKLLCRDIHINKVRSRHLHKGITQCSILLYRPPLCILPLKTAQPLLDLRSFRPISSNM